MQNSKKDSITIRINSDVKQHLIAILNANGMLLSEAIRLYLWQIITQGGIPFKGFVSTKLPPKKPDELGELDAEFQQRYHELRRKLTDNAIRKIGRDANIETVKLDRFDKEVAEDPDLLNRISY